MSFVNDIANGIVLRHAAEPSTVVLASNTRNICETTEDYSNLIGETLFETYWPLIEKFSFKSQCLGLNRDVIESIHTVYNSLPASDVIRLDDIDISDHLLTDVATQIDAAVRASVGYPCFVRTSIRSPKDVAARMIQFHEKARECLDNHDRNDDVLRALYNASIAVLSLHSAIDIVRILCASKRINDDFEMLLNGDYRFSSSGVISLVLREFVPFKCELEFRTFVVDGCISALTQYNEYFTVGELSECIGDDGVMRSFKSCISRCLCDAITSVSTKLDRFVLDFVLIATSASTAQPTVCLKGIDYRAVVIEGSGMFDWTRDSKLLSQVPPNRDDFEVRFLETPRSLGWLTGNLDKPWNLYVHR